jgi:hypothetical protein
MGNFLEAIDPQVHTLRRTVHYLEIIAVVELTVLFQVAHHELIVLPIHTHIKLNPLPLQIVSIAQMDLVTKEEKAPDMIFEEILDKLKMNLEMMAILIVEMDEAVIVSSKIAIIAIVELFPLNLLAIEVI